MNRDPVDFGLPRAVEEYTAAQLGLVFEDMEYLSKANSRLRSLVTAGQHEKAAQVARAWASFALAMAARIDAVSCYSRGARDAIGSPAQLVTVRAAERIHESGTPSPKVPKRRGGRRTPRLHDCGAHGHLSAQQMANMAHVTLNAIYCRLNGGVPPAIACLPPKQFRESVYARPHGALS